MMISTAEIQTEQADKLIIRLCKHWGHKFPVKFDEQSGEIELPMGNCRMRAGATLTVELESDAEKMPQFQQVVADHLQRMARKEDLQIGWG